MSRRENGMAHAAPTPESREIVLSETRKSRQHLWPKARASRDAELDEALRELGQDMLDQEIPERLLRVLRSAKDADKKGKRDAT